MIDKKAEGEIIQSYRLAKDKIEQVSILSELYAVPTARIRGILYAGGVYEIGPYAIEAAADRILKGASFGALRNYQKAFAGHDTKSAKKIFNDYIYMPWGAENAEAQKKTVLMANEALEASAQRNANKGRQKKETPEPPAAEPMFTDEQAGMLIAGMMMVLTEQEARAQQWSDEIERLHTTAAEIIDKAEKKVNSLNELRAEIAKGRDLLEQVKQMKTEQTPASD